MYNRLTLNNKRPTSGIHFSPTNYATPQVLQLVGANDSDLLTNRLRLLHQELVYAIKQLL